jgi:hypothetical protein
MLNDQVKNQLLSLSGLPKDLNVEEQECCEWEREGGKKKCGASGEAS